MRRFSDAILNSLIVLAHERLGLSPNQISTIGFTIGIAAALFAGWGSILTGMILLAISQIVDGLDGGVARRYGLGSKEGEQLDMLYDRLNELAIFLALAYIGQVTWLLAILAFVAILLITLIEPISGFDPGFKRFMLYFGYLATVLFHVRGFQLAMNVIFFANLAAFAIGTIMVEYRLQRDIDAQAILRRNHEREMGLPAPPDDPPSLLSKLFS